MTSSPSWAARALADAEPSVYWLDRPERPAPRPALVGEATCDLAIVGGGFTGLWAALLARERWPDLDVVVLEQDRIAEGASGRNGGFCDASLTHGLPNGVDRFPAELDRLEALGDENLGAIDAALATYGIEADVDRGGSLVVATAPHELAELQRYAELAARHHGPGAAVILDAAQTRARLDSPTYLGGLHAPTGTLMLDPARLAWGLAAACERAGVRLVERTPATGLAADGPRVRVETAHGALRARHVLLATNAFPPLVRAIRHRIVPVYDYVLVTEPLSPAQRAAIGWAGREGVSDSANQFHYYRLTRDGRILWGGYDAIYHFGNGMGRHLEQRHATYAVLAENFARTFPQLEGLRFSHRWGGAIDTCSRFSVFWGRALGGRVAYAVGYTGLGVGASRFGARVGLDLLLDPGSPLLDLQLVRTRPLPFPPEPLRYGVIELTRRSLAQADRRGGRRNPGCGRSTAPGSASTREPALGGRGGGELDLDDELRQHEARHQHERARRARCAEGAVPCHAEARDLGVPDDVGVHPDDVLDAHVRRREEAERVRPDGRVLLLRRRDDLARRVEADLSREVEEAHARLGLDRLRVARGARGLADGVVLEMDGRAHRASLLRRRTTRRERGGSATSYADMARPSAPRISPTCSSDGT